MPESYLDKDTSHCSAETRTSPLSQFVQSSLQRKLYMFSGFCTEHNVPACLSHISQEVSCLGLPPVWKESGGGSELNVVATLNCMYDLIQLHHRDMRTLENMEVEQLKSSSTADYLQLTATRLKLEISKRENTGLLERERQLQVKVKSLQNCLKNIKEEEQKLQSIIASRARQYNHEMKRKEREYNKLKERLNQLLVDKKERKPAIDVLNTIGRADGKRSLWKTKKTEEKHEGEMYKALLNNYDTRQRELMLENAELKKVLQHMKKDMISILNAGPTQNADKHEEILSEDEEEDVLDSSKESVELHCFHAREKLTNSIRLQWRRLKSHVERLDSQVSLTKTDEGKDTDVSRETHEEERDRLQEEIQHCKDLIQTQQQLFQVTTQSCCQHVMYQQLSASYDEEAPTVASNCWMLKEKECLQEEWRTLEEQRMIFEKKRKNFTEAAIRLSHERKAFEEDRATWLKYQFLNSNPFADSKNPSESKSAFPITEIETGATLDTEKLEQCRSESTSSTPSSTKPKRKTETMEQSSVSGENHQRIFWKEGSNHDGYSNHILTDERNSPI
ncbi:afadin- and alpha-actinin-binding protein isoform X2 [Gouania willdenowi]|uniref:afadin- and alpha-actinin-binding protein isoform X2 n=1 Tax=Gouania willdenowi TaxID=441366 RepID=UPI0010557572|nr:afadin- and alpha-actinin-binding protein isoform X2 [Gouania willdenowi]